MASKPETVVWWLDCGSKAMFCLCLNVFVCMCVYIWTHHTLWYLLGWKDRSSPWKKLDLYTCNKESYWISLKSSQDQVINIWLHLLVTCGTSVIVCQSSVSIDSVSKSTESGTSCMDYKAIQVNFWFERTTCFWIKSTRYQILDSDIHRILDCFLALKMINEFTNEL